MRLKIAFFTDILIRDFDGACRTMFHLIDRISSDQFEFLFFCGEHQGVPESSEVFSLPTIKIPFNNHYALALPNLDRKRLKARLQAFSPDVIHIASPSLLGNFAVDYGRERGIPVISIYHTHFISYVSYYSRNLPLLTSLAQSAVISGQRKFYDKCDLILVPTDNILKALTGYGFNHGNMLLWPRGMNHKCFHPGKKEVEKLSKLTHNLNPNLLFASRLVWEKNLHLLVQLYDLYKRNNEKVNFIIIGEGVAKEELEKRMPEAYFLGKLTQEELASYYASCDAFVFPSISETYGNVVVEAMASGCPCVIADGGGSASLISQGINGFLCDATDAEDFYIKLNILFKSDEIRSRFIKNGLSFTASLDWKALADRYFSHLRNLSIEKAVG